MADELERFILRAMRWNRDNPLTEDELLDDILPELSAEEREAMDSLGDIIERIRQRERVTGGA